MVAAAGGGFFVLTQQSDAAQSGANTQTVTASLETLEQSVEGTGTLSPTVQEDVSFVASGTVTKVAVKEGDTVTKGQTLATVDTLTMNANLLSAKADLADAESQLATAEDDADGTTASDAQIAARKAAVTVAEQKVETAQEAMDGTTLKSPVAGLVTSVGIAKGDAVTGSSSSGSSGSSASSGSAGGSTGGSSAQGASTGGGSSGSSSSSTSSSTSQFTIVGQDSWGVSVSLGETEVGLIKAGDQVEMTTDDDTTLFGVVSEIGLLPSTTSGSPTYPVSITVTGDTSGLFDGTSVTATIIYERRVDVLTVASSAITTDADGTSTVTLVDADGKETTQTVTVGESSGNLTEITDGLSEGDTVLVTVFTPVSSGTSSDSSNRQGDSGFPGGGTDGNFPGGGGGEMPAGGFPGGGGR